MRKSIVPVIGCIVINICVGILYLWSVFKMPVLASFSWNAGAVKMVSSYMLFAFVAGNLIGGFINDKKGPRLTAILGVVMFSLGIFLTGFLTKETIGWMNLTYCVLGGLGSGFAYGACISCIQKWLPHRKGLASGLAVSAFAFSTVIFTPVSNWLMEKYQTGSVMIDNKPVMLVDFQPVFMTLAIVFFIAGIIGTFLVRLPDEAYLKQLPASPASAKVFTGKNYTLSQAMKTVPFWCIFLEILFINGTWTLAVPLIVPEGVKHGLTPEVAVAVLTVTGIFNAGGRLIMATVSDKLGRTTTIIILSVLTCIGAGLMIAGVTGFGFAIAICIIAFGYGGPASTNAAFTTDFFGPKNSGTNYGVAMLALGFSSILFNTISTQLLKDNFQATFVMAAISAVIPIILMVIINREQKKMQSTAV